VAPSSPPNGDKIPHHVKISEGSSLPLNQTDETIFLVVLPPSAFHISPFAFLPLLSSFLINPFASTSLAFQRTRRAFFLLLTVSATFSGFFPPLVVNNVVEPLFVSDFCPSPSCLFPVQIALTYRSTPFGPGWDCCLRPASLFPGQFWDNRNCFPSPPS